MTTVSVSPKFQVVIPKDVRRALNLQAGQRVDIRVVGGQAILEPQVDIRSLRGFLAGISTDVPNDPEGVCWPGGCDPAPEPFWPAP